MILKKIKVDVGLGTGEETNCYIIMDDVTKETMVIDPAGEVDKIVEMLGVIKAKVKYIIATHCHGDHIGGMEELKNKVGGKTMLHIYDAANINDESITLNYYIGLSQTAINIDSRLNDEDIIHLGDVNFTIIHTPGHTSGSICIYCKEYGMLFSGDTVFRGTWGRTDLPTGSFEDIINSIQNKVMILPEETLIYPGHGKATIIQEEEPIYLGLRGKD